MKRIFALTIMALAISGCDDGDLIFEELDFDDVQIARCPDISTDVESNILYKLNGAETLVLYVDDLATEFPTEPTPENTPDSIDIDGTNARLVYRLYSSDAAAANICDAIQPGTPTVQEEWIAIAGTVKITTTAVKTVNTTGDFIGGENITDMRHAIVIENVTFQTPNNQIVYETFPFGNYDVDFNRPTLNIGGTPTLCDLDDTLAYDAIYRTNSNQAFTINVDPALLDTSILNTPKTGVISGQTNSVMYQRFATPFPEDPEFNFCDIFNPNPATNPNDGIEVWKSIDGVAGVSGIVEVTTTTFGTNGFQHTIRLKNVYLQNETGTLSFKIADDYLYGEFQQ